MVEDATTRYEQRTKSITHKLLRAPRMVYRNRRTQYTALTPLPNVGELGHVDSAEMYGALLREMEMASRDYK